MHKYALDGTKIGSALKDHKEVHYGDTDVDHYGNKKYSVELTDKNWAPIIKEHKVVLVNFHAPWCPHCQVARGLSHAPPSSTWLSAHAPPEGRLVDQG